MTPKKGAPRRGKKQSYRAPELKVHGDLKSITLTKHGAKNDGGAPKPNTRTSGGQA
jgi:hypothetical protein